MMTQLGPELELLAGCIRRALGEAVPVPDSREIDWEVLVRRVIQHSLAPIVYASLSGTDLPVPAAARQQLRAEAAGAELRRQLWFEPSLRRTLDALAAVGVEPIVLKGAALAYQAYPSPGCRTMVDLDLLVRPDELLPADRALADLGYRPGGEPLQPGHHHLPCRYTPDGMVPIELHHHLIESNNPYTIDLEPWWQRSTRARLGAVEARVPAPEDMLFHLCLHLAYGDRYRRRVLRGLTDVLAHVRATNGRLDWDRFLATVEQGRAAGAVYWPLRLSRTWLEAPIPRLVLARLAPPRAMRRIIEPAIESTQLLNGEAPAGWGVGVLHDSLRELSLHSECSPRQQAASVLNCLFPPPQAIGHLPPQVTTSRLRYAAYLSRPLRVGRGVAAFGRLLLEQSRRGREPRRPPLAEAHAGAADTTPGALPESAVPPLGPQPVSAPRPRAEAGVGHVHPAPRGRAG